MYWDIAVPYRPPVFPSSMPPGWKNIEPGLLPRITQLEKQSQGNMKSLLLGENVIIMLGIKRFKIIW